MHTQSESWVQVSEKDELSRSAEIAEDWEEPNRALNLSKEPEGEGRMEEGFVCAKRKRQMQEVTGLQSMRTEWKASLVQ